MSDIREIVAAIQEREIEHQSKFNAAMEDADRHEADIESSLHGEIMELEQKLGAAQKEIEQLREALLSHGWHHKDCIIGVDKCSCGLKQALNPTPPTNEEPIVTGGKEL